MLFYGIGQYLIVFGITKEVKQPEDDLIMSSQTTFDPTFLLSLIPEDSLG